MRAKKTIEPQDIKTALGRRLLHLLSAVMVPSVSELSERTGIDRTTVYRWFTKTEAPKYHHLLKLSEVLIVHPKVILGIEPGEAVDRPLERRPVVDPLAAIDRDFKEHLQSILSCEYCRPHREKIIHFIRALEITLQINPKI